jgi:Transposase domain (DUF772)
MMGRQTLDPRQLFYPFNLGERIPSSPSVTPDQSNRRLDTGCPSRQTATLLQRNRRPSIDPKLMLRMLIVGYCYGICSERKLCEAQRVP